MNDSVLEFTTGTSTRITECSVHMSECFFEFVNSEAFLHLGSIPRPYAHLFTKTLFIPFV